MSIRFRAALSLLSVSLAFVSVPAFAADAGVTTVYDKPIAVARKAAEDALATIGVMKLKKSEPELLEGQRSRKVGAFVGSGGEILTVTLKSLDANRTEVTVKTKKTFVGMAGQKNWNEPLTGEISKLLSAPATQPAATSDAAAPAEAAPAAPAVEAPPTTPPAEAAPTAPATPATPPQTDTAMG
jgi:hypothetical protein